MTPPKQPKTAKNPKGAGRPAKLLDGRRINLWLDSESIARAESIGLGNVSEGVRKALNERALNERK